MSGSGRVRVYGTGIHKVQLDPSSANSEGFLEFTGSERVSHGGCRRGVGVRWGGGRVKPTPTTPDRDSDTTRETVVRTHTTERRARKSIRLDLVPTESLGRGPVMKERGLLC